MPIDGYRGQKSGCAGQILDSELLRRYADDRSDAAFGQLVQRHVSLVYSVALRQCGGDTHLAEDVTQKVFTDLARKARLLSGYAVLGGWLYRSAQFAASDAVRAERRRRVREQEARAMQDLSQPTDRDADWQKLAPVLDQAIAELAAEDRDAVVLRFFESRPFVEIGANLRLTEDAARMRVKRALDKLHAALLRRGVTSTAAALGLALANQAGVGAPAGLAASVTGAALAGVAASGTCAAGLGAIGFMSTAKLMIGTAALGVLTGIGTWYVGGRSAQAAQESLATATTHETVLTARLSDLDARVNAEARRVQAAEKDYATLSAEVTRLSAPAPAGAEPITSDVVSRRFKLAQELVRSGDPAEALRELLWCYDIGMPRISGMSAVRTTSLSLFGKLGTRYPPALEVLRERRDKARVIMMTSEREFAATQEFAAANHALKDEAANVALLDQLPEGDRRRRTLASASYDFLVENRRYGEAIEGRPYSSISSIFELTIDREATPNLPNSEEIHRSGRDYLIVSTAKSIEALAGAGDLDHARQLAERLLAYDPADSTRALIQKHAERAGQPGLLSAPVNR